MFLARDTNSSPSRTARVRITLQRFRVPVRSSRLAHTVPPTHSRQPFFLCSGFRTEAGNPTYVFVYEKPVAGPAKAGVAGSSITNRVVSKVSARNRQTVPEPAGKASQPRRRHSKGDRR